jgi:hypothetical protein
MSCCDCGLGSVFIDGRIRLCFNYFVNLSVEYKFCVSPLKKEQNDSHTPQNSWNFFSNIIANFENFHFYLNILTW